MAAKLAVRWPAPGRYVVAVSGGRDSVALLHLLATAAHARGYQLVVAHFNHRQRPDAARDAELVRAAAKRYGLPFALGQADGPLSAEAAARAARYQFLRHTCSQHRAAAIITAHHQDDLLETSLLNLARGTGRHGLAPMQGGDPLRPLLGVTRAELTAYAQRHQLQWREDSTNQDRSNPRNFLRHELLAGATPQWRRQYLRLMRQLATINETADGGLQSLVNKCNIVAKKTYGAAGENPGPSVEMAHAVAQDLSLAELAELIRYLAHQLKPGLELERRLLDELALFAKTGRTGRRRPLRGGLVMQIGRQNIEISFSLTLATSSPESYTR